MSIYSDIFKRPIQCYSCIFRIECMDKYDDVVLCTEYKIKSSQSVRYDRNHNYNRYVKETR